MSADSVPSSKTNIFQNKHIYCRHFRTYLRCAMLDWSDTVFRRRNVTRRRISNTVLQPRYWGREADSPRFVDWAGNMFDGIFTGLMRLFKHELFRDLFISQSSSMYIPNEAILVYTWLLDTYLTWIYFLDLTKICPRPLVATALGIWKVLEFINTYTNRKHRFLSLEMTIETPYTMYMYNILICIETIYCLKWSSVKLIAIAFWFWIIL
jgi:hypothetical protein